MVRILSALLMVARLSQEAMAAKVSPVQKVLDMLGDMRVKGEKAAADEKKLYAKYTEFVDDETKRLNFEIETGKKQIDRSTARIAKVDSDVENLGHHIEEVTNDVERMDHDKKEAMKMRKEEHDEFQRVSKDYGQSIQALDNALETVRGQNVDRPQAAMLLQKLSAEAPLAQDAVASFTQETLNDEEDSTGAPAAAAYQSQSDNLVAMLERLQEKFTEELHEAETDESNRVQNYDMVMLHLNNGLKESKAQLGQKTASKGKAVSDAAALNGDLEAARTELGADEKLLADMTATHEAKSAAFSDNQKVRAQELQALAKASEIISSPAVANSYGKHVKLMQVSFLQLGSANTRIASAKKAAIFLEHQATVLSSKSLAALATKMMANPFAKVVDMIQDLLAKLKQEAEEEADHKAWCDQQLRENKQKRQRRTTQANKLNAEIDDLNSKIEKMGEEIEELTKEQAELTRAQEKATDSRQAEKAENEETIADSQAAHAAVQQALTVLEEFYSAQADESSFVQREAPEMSTYKGMGGAGGGVLGMLEVIASDFVRLTAETNTAERQAATEYDAFMRDSKEDNEAKHALEVKTKLDKDQAEFEKSQNEDDLASTSDELAKASAYFEELKPQCVEVKVSFEERAAARKNEIEALRNAHKLLNDAKSAA